MLFILHRLGSTCTKMLWYQSLVQVPSIYCDGTVWNLSAKNADLIRVQMQHLGMARFLGKTSSVCHINSDSYLCGSDLPRKQQPRNSHRDDKPSKPFLFAYLLLRYICEKEHWNQTRYMHHFAACCILLPGSQVFRTYVSAMGLHWK